MLKLIKYELKKQASKSLIIFGILFILFTFLDNVLQFKYGGSKPDLVAGNFGLSLLLTQFYLIFLACTYISSEFHMGTSKSIFTGVFSRIEIVNIKTISIMLISLALGGINWTIGLILEVVLYDGVTITSALNDLLMVIVIYFLYFIGVLAFSLFVSSISLSRIITILFGYGTFIFIGEIAVQITNRSESLRIAIEKIPFYVITSGFNSLYYNGESIIIILLFSTIFYLAAIMIFQKRDLT